MVLSCDPDRNGNGRMKILFECNTLSVTWYKTVTQINLSITFVQDERKQIFPERMVSFILVNNSISRGQLQYTDNLIYTNNSDDVNAETLLSSEKGHKCVSSTHQVMLHSMDFNPIQQK